MRWYVSAGTQSLDDSSQDLVTGKDIIYILRREPFQDFQGKSSYHC